MSTLAVGLAFRINVVHPETEKHDNNAKIILLAIADIYNDDTRKCYFKLSKLIEKTGLSERSIRYKLRLLESLDLIKVIPQRHKQGGWKINNAYRLLFVEKAEKALETQTGKNCRFRDRQKMPDQRPAKNAGEETIQNETKKKGEPLDSEKLLAMLKAKLPHMREALSAATLTRAGVLTLPAMRQADAIGSAISDAGLGGCGIKRITWRRAI